jgi:hypothetical protein
MRNLVKKMWLNSFVCLVCLYREVMWRNHCPAPRRLRTPAEADQVQGGRRFYR